MTLTPLDIQSKQFHVRFRGFDVEEVDAFLEQAAENFLIQVEENKTLSQKVEALTQELSGMKVEEDSFKDALISAKQVAEEMKNKSRHEADELVSTTRQEADELLSSTRQEAEDIIRDANEESTKIKNEAHQEVAELELNVDQLKGTQSKLRSELRNVLQSYQRFLDLPDEVLNSGQVAAAVPLSKSEIVEENVVSVDEAELNLVEDDTNSESDNEPASYENEDIPQPDLSDLYEKIDLSQQDDPEIVEQDEEGSVMDLSEPILPDQTMDTVDLSEEIDSPTMPDLDDDYMFTLEDPLDKDGDKKE